MFRTRFVFAALASLALTAIVHAQTPAKPTTPAAAPASGTPAAPTPGAKPGMMPGAQASRFDEIDTNKDGFISRDEFMAAEKKRFDEFDTNHDGKVDAKEIANSPPLMERNLRTAERMMKQWDADGDGVVTAAEYNKMAEQRFAQQDKEGTGKIARRAPPMMPPGMPGKPGMPQQKVIQPAPTPAPTKP